MKRVFSNPIVALAAGLGLRLYFVLRFPANSGDTVLYEEIATNWLKHHIYAMTVGGQITPDVTGRTGADARLWVMLAQIAVDLLTCLLIARLASLLVCTSEDSAPDQRVQSISLWLAALCPFTANYTAVPLTEVFATFWTALAYCALAIALRRVSKPDSLLKSAHPPLRKSVEDMALAAGLIVGVGTLFRPEAPLLLVAAACVFGGLLFQRGNYRRWMWVCLALALGCVMILFPWAIRNMVTLGEPQFLAPKNSNLPGELVPHGFMSSANTSLSPLRHS